MQFAKKLFSKKKEIPSTTRLKTICELSFSTCTTEQATKTFKKLLKKSKPSLSKQEYDEASVTIQSLLLIKKEATKMCINN